MRQLVRRAKGSTWVKKSARELRVTVGTRNNLERESRPNIRLKYSKGPTRLAGATAQRHARGRRSGGTAGCAHAHRYNPIEAIP